MSERLERLIKARRERGPSGPARKRQERGA
jgi:hypothetical protein